MQLGNGESAGGELDALKAVDHKKHNSKKNCKDEEI